MADKLIILCALTALIHAAETLSYAVRLAGVRTGRLAVSLSLTGMIVLISRTSNLIQAPLMGNVIDSAKRNSSFDLELMFRYIVGAASGGTLAALVLFPSVVFISARVIAQFEASGSIPALITSVTFDKLKKAGQHLRTPNVGMLRSLRIMGIPKRLLLLNTVVTAFYTVGVLASLYASFLDPEHSITASQSSGLINGIATIILTIFIDPRLAVLTDRAMTDEMEKERLGRVFAMLIISRFAGTLLAQLLLYPSALWIKWMIGWM